MRFCCILLAFLSGLSPWMVQGQAAIQQDFESQIAKANSLYYQGQYADALALLTPLDDALTKNNQSAADQSKVKMLLGLTEIALDDTDKARTRFLQFCSMNPDYVLDEQQYPRKVVTVFKDAQKECTKCAQICIHAESLAAAGDTQGIADAKAETEYCACASRNFARDEPALAPGRALMSQEKYSEAFKEFQKALEAVPESAARREAVQTAQAKVDSTVQAAVLDWRQQFFSRQWERAAAIYDRIRLLGADSSRPVREEMLQITTQYQTTFNDLLSSWNTACSGNDRVALNAIHDWAKALDPNMTIQPTVINRMSVCTSSPQPKGNTK